MASTLPRQVDVLVIGNGPSALILSYILHGHIPIYDLANPHPDPILHEKLKHTRDLLGLDVDELTQHFPASRFSYSTQALPVNVLYDTLIRPYGETEDNKTCVKWTYDPARAIPHVVVGDTAQPGGQWVGNPVDASWSIGTLSYARMLSLPGYSFDEFFHDAFGCDLPFASRPTRRNVADYLAKYADKVGIADSIVSGVHLSRIRRDGSGFYVSSHDIRCQQLVLASGIFSALNPAQPLLQPLTLLPSSPQVLTESCLLVVGSGFTAADVIISTHPRQKILHIFKWDPSERPSPLRGCHQDAYPEYAGVYRRMKAAALSLQPPRDTKSRPRPHRRMSMFDKSREWDANYEGLPNTEIIGVDLKDNCTRALVRLQNNAGAIFERYVSGFAYVAGRHGTVDFLEQDLLDEMHVQYGQPISARTFRLATHEALEVAHRIFVIGSLTGDSLIRFSYGSCCKVAGTLLKDWPRQTEIQALPDTTPKDHGDECVYGKAEPAEYNKPGLEEANSRHAVRSGSSEPPVTRSSDIRGDDSAAASRSLQDAQLAALEEQLARLTSLVEGMRKDTLASASNGLQTPVSSRSPNGDASSRHNYERVTRYGAAPLDDSVAELGLRQMRESRNLFCQAVSEELDNLQHLLQGPFGSLGPDGGDHVKYGALQEPHVATGDQHSRPLTFLSAVRGDNLAQTSLNCRTCQQAAVDKSIFLLGLSSQQARAPSNMDLVKGLPSESQGNVLFRAWMTGVFPVLPYLPMERVVPKFRALWEWKRLYDQSPKDVTESMDVYSLPLINAIWYSGVLALSAKGLAMWFPGQDRAELAAHYHDQTVKYLAFLSFPTTVQIHFISAAVLLEFLPVAEQEPLQSSSYLNMILKLAQSIGLNRENSLTGLAPDEAELRRRLWAYIVRLDTAFSVACGLPPTIDDTTVDTRPISEVKERYIGQLAEREHYQGARPDRVKGTTVDDPYTGTRSIVSVYHVVARAQLLVDNTLRKIVRLHTGPQKITRETIFMMNELITQVEDQIKDIICSLPTNGIPELGFEPETGPTPLYDCDPVFGTQIQEAELSSYVGGDPAGLPSSLARYHRQKQCAFNKWARIVLSLVCDKLHCLGYAPFLKNARSKLWTTGRHCALHHATSFLRKFVCLASDPALEPFRWTWPAMYQPMHAAIIVLIDLYERPFSVEAARNRSWIDKIFALADPSAGIVGGLNGVSIQRPLHEGGAAVFDQFRGLRSSAWRRAGLDPDVLWTEEDQMLVGVAKPLTEDQRIAQRLREDMLYDHEDTKSSTSSNITAVAHSSTRTPITAADSATNHDSSRAHILEYALSEHAEQVLASNKPMAYRPVRIEGQRKMPFPLSTGLKHQYLITKIKTFAGKQHGSMEGRDETIAVKQDDIIAIGKYGGNSATSSKGHIFDQQPFLPPNDAAQAQAQSQAQLIDSTMPTIHEQMDNNSPDYFDWDRWDAVFSQYGNFTDFMEDVQWEGQ
ncbi:hypothetical protein DV737_g3581, partial [Chaetothyriales sp. CBS 132003]